jgi:hypothetical protein
MDSLVDLAAIVAAALVVAVAAFQVALGLGVPLGDATLGGRATTSNGVLSGRFRVLAVLQAAILLLLAWVILARAGIVDAGGVGDQVLYWATWVIVGFLALNTLANFSAPHPVERWLMGSITLAVGILTAIVALGTPT